MQGACFLFFFCMRQKEKHKKLNTLFINNLSLPNLNFSLTFQNEIFFCCAIADVGKQFVCAN